jgi:hypothetical protein
MPCAARSPVRIVVCNAGAAAGGAFLLIHVKKPAAARRMIFPSAFTGRILPWRTL